MTLPVGTRVSYTRNGRERTGYAAACNVASSTETCVSDGPSGMGLMHLRDDQLTIIGVSGTIPEVRVSRTPPRYTFNSDMFTIAAPVWGEQVRVASEVLGRFGSSVSEAAQSIETVGTADTNNEGDSMPTINPEAEFVTIPVEHTSASRTLAFDNLGTRSVLMSGLNADTWLQALAALEDACGDIQWTVERGSFRLGSYPEAVINGYPTRIENISFENAQEFLAAASNNRLTLGRHADNPRRVTVKPISDLEDRAFRLYAGNGQYMNLGDPYDGTGDLVNLRNLAELMRYYTQFMNASDRREYVRMALRERMNDSVRGVRTPEAEAQWTGERINKFDRFLSGVKSKLVPEANPFYKLPMLPHKTLTSRTWGIEIEAVDIAGVSTPEYWELKGDGSLRSLHVESKPSRMVDPEYTGIPLPEVTEEDDRPQPPTPVARDEHDSDCDYYEDDDEDCNCGLWQEQDAYSDAYEEYVRAIGGNANGGGRRTQTGEWNSPVLRSFHSRGLKYLTGELEMRDTNDSAGVHVHVAAGDLTPDQAIQVGIIYSALEPLFEKEYKRNPAIRNYCKSVDTAELIQRFNQMKDVKARKLGADSMRFGSRYWTVNLASLQRHKTIEFRAMGPIYNYEHLTRWAYLVREIVNIAKADVPQAAWSKVRTIEDLVTLFSKYGKETPTPSWADNEPNEELTALVVEKLGSENRRVPHTQRLIPGQNQPRLVNDDYSDESTYMLGQRTNARADEPVFGSYTYSGF